MGSFKIKLHVDKVSKPKVLNNTMEGVDIRPNLLLAGFQKCGSSSLFHMLNKHPEITGSMPKESFPTFPIKAQSPPSLEQLTA